MVSLKALIDYIFGTGSPHRTRVLASLVLIPIVLGIIGVGGGVFAAFLFLLMIIALFEWGMMAYKTDNFALYLITGFVYLLLCFDCLYTMRVNHPLWIGCIFLVMVWGSDTGGYVFGKKFGRIKMCPSISPNKTWAGFSGALITPAIIGALGALAFPYFYILWQNILFFIVLGVVTGAAGQGGDLLVSYVKRLAGVKDTGKLIPGHGGILDRIDSLLLCAPIFLTIITEARHVFG